MATRTFRGDAQAVAQVTTFTVGGTAANGQVYTVTCNLKTVSYTATGTDTNNSIASALQALLAASTIAEFTEAGYTVSSNVITATAATAGWPFTMTTSATGTGTLTASTTTSNSGPNCWDVASNWAEGAIPANGDDVVITKTSTSIYHGLDQSAVALNSLTIEASFTGTIGLPLINTGSGSAGGSFGSTSGYREYRSRYLAIGASTVVIGSGSGSGSGRIQLDLGTTTSWSMTVYGTGTSLDANANALLVKGNGSLLAASKGSIGLNTESGDTSTVTAIRTGYVNTPQTDVNLTIGAGATITTLDISGGVINCYSGFTTLNMTAGTLTVQGGALNATTLNVTGGTVYYQATGTLTTVNLATGAIFDRSRDNRSCTIGTLNLYSGCTFLDPTKAITFTNPIVFKECGVADLAKLDLGKDFTLARV